MKFHAFVLFGIALANAANVKDDSQPSAAAGIPLPSATGASDPVVPSPISDPVLPPSGPTITPNPPVPSPTADPSQTSAAAGPVASAISSPIPSPPSQGNSCSSDSDCKGAFNQICRNSACIPRAGPGGQCATNSDCLDGLVCGGSNPAISTCAVPVVSSASSQTPVPTPTSQGNNGDSCSSDSDCKGAFNLICRNNVCRPRFGPGGQCASDSDCLDGLVCGGDNPAIRICAVPSASSSAQPSSTPVDQSSSQMPSSTPVDQSISSTPTPTDTTQPSVTSVVVESSPVSESSVPTQSNTAQPNNPSTATPSWATSSYFTVTQTPTGTSQPTQVVIETVFVPTWPQNQWIPPNVVVVVSNTPINKPSNVPQPPPTVLFKSPFGGAASISINWLTVGFAVLGSALALVLV